MLIHYFYNHHRSRRIMKQIRLLFCLFILCFSLTSCKNKPDRSTASKNRNTEFTPPNIVLILADDLGYGDLRCYGNQNDDTPNLDRMARGGVLFTDFHSNCPVCSPTRAALLSGKYQQRVGIEYVVHATRFRHTGLEPDTYTLAGFMKSMGYSTGIMGKWHLGYDTTYSPLNFGFDIFKGYVSGNVDYQSHIDGAGIYDWWEQKDTIIEPGYSTDLITQNSVRFIENHKDVPFFLYVAHEAPHFPYQGRNDPAVRSPEGTVAVNGSPSDVKETYRKMISAMDEGIGGIFRVLEECELTDNTVIFFLSDNGANEVGSNGHLRGFKGSLWEGGHRVPAIISWKGKIRPGTCGETLIGMDIFPTVAALVGGELPESLELDGVDFSSLLLEQAPLGDRPLFWRYGELRSIRSGPWKLLRDGDSTYLFNLAEDESEKTDLAQEHPGLSDSLQFLLDTWDSEMNNYKLNTYR